MRVRDLSGQRVVVWGFGAEGRAAVKLLQRHGHAASLSVVVDAESAVVHDPGVEVLSGVRAARAVAAADVIVKSPGVSPYVGGLADAKTSAVITGGTAMWFAETGGDNTIAVTGSKGKSTTTSLVAHFLAALGIPTTLAGNVGRPMLDVLDEELSVSQRRDSSPTAPPTTAPPATVPPMAPMVYALELSSFQTAEVRHSPTVGVLTALFPEHLDWHGTVERYYADKCNLFAHRPAGALVANFDNANVVRRCSGGLAGSPVVMPYAVTEAIHLADPSIVGADGIELFDLSRATLVGRHNAINLCGALSALRAYGIDLAGNRSVLQTAIESFAPLEHRLQPVGHHRGRLVIDDSLSTAPQAAVAALAAFADRPVGIIVGGHDRGLDYTPLAEALAIRTTPTWVLGVPLSGERIVPLIRAALAAAQNPNVVVEAFDDFDDAVRRASDLVPEGGVLLLSPAAPSFGRFTDYHDRGLHFRSLLGLH